MIAETPLGRIREALDTVVGCGACESCAELARLALADLAVLEGKDGEPREHHPDSGIRVATISSAIAAHIMHIIKERLEAGARIEIPELGIVLTRDGAEPDPAAEEEHGR